MRVNSATRNLRKQFPMSPQLRFSAAVSALTMALFALTMGLGGMKDGAGFEAELDAPAIYSATLGV
jgi:hypothetical protein